MTWYRLIFVLGLSLAGITERVSAIEPILVDKQDVSLSSHELPDISSFDREFVLESLSKHKVRGQSQIQRLYAERSVLTALYSVTFADLAARQDRVPQGIFISQGLMTLMELAQENPGYVHQVSEQIYEIYKPLVILPGAALVVSNGEQMRLSEDDGAYLFSAGDLYVIDATIMGWRKKENDAASYTGDPLKFRPFFLAYGGSQTYILDSKISHLGYQARASYGFTLKGATQAGLAGLSNTLRSQLARTPKSWIVDSHFEQLYFGFYCGEIHHTVIVGNRYHDNIVYGIDPHDYATDLIIARNRVSGTREKHGIILSREVTNSWIFENNVHNNNRSGIMMDRSSNGNVIAFNESYENGGDGITLYESSDTLVYGNRVYKNAEHGIRVRNSLKATMRNNVVLGNQGAGIYFHTRSLADHTYRDLSRDPYEERVSGTVDGGLIAGNRAGAAFSANIEELKLGHISVYQNGHSASSAQFRGEIRPFDTTLRYSLFPPEKWLRLAPRSTETP